MMGGYFYVTIFLFVIPFGFFTPAPLDDLTINLNLNEGYNDNDRDVTNPNRDVTDVNKKQLNDYEDEDVLNLNECVKEKNVGYNEDRFESKSVGGEEECANWCEEVDECEFWTFTKFTKRCVLFGADSDKINQTGRVSGTKSCAKGDPNFESEGIQTEEEVNGQKPVQDNGNDTINYAFCGYNIFYGNPLHPGDAAPDQGFKKHIFDVIREEGKTAPVGTEMFSCTGCDTKTSTSLLSGTAKYQKSLEEIANVGTTLLFESFQAKFSASTNYRKVEEKTSNNSNFISHSQLECCTYRINMQSPYSQYFNESVMLLTDEYDEDLYNHFIREFGTHYVTQADYGSLFGEQTIISRESWTRMESEGIEISAAASASAVVEYLAANSSTNSSLVDAKTFDEYNSDQLLYTLGSLPPADNKPSTWLEEAKKDPMPIKFHLSPILELFNNKSAGISVSEAVKDNLKKVYEDYCDRLKNATEVKSCDAPGPDPDFPGKEFTRVYKDWITGITSANRSQKHCDDFTHVTWIQFNYAENTFGEGYSKDLPILTNLFFGCSNGKVYDLTGTQFDEEKKTTNITCDNKNGFRQMEVQLSDSEGYMDLYGFSYEPPNPILINAGMQCFDDSKSQYAISPYIEPCGAPGKDVFCTWKKWVGCDGDKNERMVGFQIQQRQRNIDSIYHQYIIDIRFQCATFN